jgi:hypothetical protein
LVNFFQVSEAYDAAVARPPAIQLLVDLVRVGVFSLVAPHAPSSIVLFPGTDEEVFDRKLLRAVTTGALQCGEKNLVF